MSEPKKEGDLCPKGHSVVRLPRMFYWRGQYFHGLVCQVCKSLYDDPSDSFWEVAALGRVEKRDE